MGHPVCLTRLGVMAKHLAAIIVGDRGLAGEQPSRLPILPHLANLDDRFNSIIVPQALDPDRAIVGPVPNPYADRSQGERMFVL